MKRLVSKRTIDTEIYELENKNVLIECQFLDPYHLISLELEVEPRTKQIVNANSQFTNFPTSVCPWVEQKAQLLKGLIIRRGIIKEVSKAVGGGDGCIHLRELSINAINFAATALIGYDQGYGLMSRDFNILTEEERYEQASEILKGTCHAFKP